MSLTDIIQVVERVGYPIAVSAWLIWYVTAQSQRMLAWTTTLTRQLDDLQDTVDAIARRLDVRDTTSRGGE